MPNGKVFSFWSAGMVCYACAVFLVNSTLLKMTNGYGGINELWLLQ